MSTIDLTILGILLDKPMNAYEITNYVAEKQIGRLLKISTPAIYKSCKRLHKADYLDGRIVKEGEQPEKTVYSINKNGKAYFYELMENFSSTVKPYYFDFNAFLYNIEKAGKQHGLEMLQNLHNDLSRWKAWIVEHEKEQSKNMPFASKAIVKQYRMTVSTLLDWCKETIQDYKKITS